MRKHPMSLLGCQIWSFNHRVQVLRDPNLALRRLINSGRGFASFPNFASIDERWHDTHGQEVWMIVITVGSVWKSGFNQYVY